MGKERAKQWDQNFVYLTIGSAVVLFANLILIIVNPLRKNTKCAGKTNTFWIMDVLLLCMLGGFTYAAKQISDVIDPKNAKN